MTYINETQMLDELYELRDENYDISKLVIIGEAAKILNNIISRGTTSRETYDPDYYNKDIEIWVDPKYYDYLVNYEGKCEAISENPCIWLEYNYSQDIDGHIKLYKGIGKKPKSAKIQGFNVQIIDYKGKIMPTSRLEKLKNFRVVK